MSVHSCFSDLPTPDSSTAFQGGMCFEEDYELEDWDLEDDPADDSETSASAADKTAQGLQAALKAEREKRQALASQLEEIRTAKAAADEASAAEAGQFKDLYEKLKKERDAELLELKALKSEKKARLEALTASNKERLEALPEDWRDMVPEGLTPSKTAAQIGKIEKRLAASEDRPAGGARGKPPKKTDAHIPARYKERCETEAARYGMDPKKYWSARMRPRLVKQKKIKE